MPLLKTRKDRRSLQITSGGEGETKTLCLFLFFYIENSDAIYELRLLKDRMLGACKKMIWHVLNQLHIICVKGIHSSITGHRSLYSYDHISVDVCKLYVY